MASFCSGCGFPQNAGVAFCPNGGTRQQGATSAAVPPQPVPPPLVAPAKAGSGLKILLALVVFMGVAGIAAIGGLYYMAHRVKEAVIDKAKSYGVDLPSTAPAHSSATPRQVQKGCGVLSASEVSGL